MNQQHIADLSAELIIKYYENDYMPFLSHMDDDALWYGPAEGQFLRGRERMIEVWNAEEHSLKFSLGNIEEVHISSHPSYCDVRLRFQLDHLLLQQRAAGDDADDEFRADEGQELRTEGNSVLDDAAVVCDRSDACVYREHALRGFGHLVRISSVSADRLCLPAILRCEEK